MSRLSFDPSRVTVVGFDLAKHIFQVHCIDAEGAVVVNRSLRRREVLSFFASLPPCRVGMEACGSAHHWGRALAALGHDVKMMPPAYVKPYVRRQKNDAADAAAICEAQSRPGLRFVKVRSIANQAVHEVEVEMGDAGLPQGGDAARDQAERLQPIDPGLHPQIERLRADADARHAATDERPAEIGVDMPRVEFGCPFGIGIHAEMGADGGRDAREEIGR